MEDLMNHMKDSEQQGDMTNEASSETKRSYVIKTDGLCMIAGTAEGKQPFEDVFGIDEDLEVKDDKENFSEEEEFDWIQQEETMLAENIIKDHHSIMMIGTMEITRETFEAVIKKKD